MPGTPEKPTVLPPEPEEKKLTAKEKKKLETLTTNLKSKLEKTIKDIVSIGQDLIEVQTLIGEKSFAEHVEEHFDMGYRTAYRFINVAKNLGSYAEVVAPLSQRALYLLSGPNVPEEKRKEIIDLIQEDKIHSHKEIQAHLEEAEESEEEDDSASPRTMRIKSFSKGVSKLYSQASKQLQGYSGKLNTGHKEQLEQMRSQLQELDGWIGEILEKPEPAPKQRGRKKKK